MEETVIVIMLKDAETGFLEKELSYSYSDLDISGNKVYAISASGGLFLYELCALDVKEIEFVSDNIPTKSPNGKDTKARIKIQNESGKVYSGTLILAIYEGNENKRLKNVVADNVLAENGVETVVETDALGFDNLDKAIDACKGSPVYLTIDLDVLDPSVFPGTGTPEAGGVTFRELLDAIVEVSGLNIVAMDINELSPVYDQSGVSTAVACKILRELLLAVSK